MRAVRRRVKPNRLHPGPNDPGILPGRKMGRLRNAAWKEVLLWLQMGGADPGGDRGPGLLGDLKLHWSLGLLLHDNRAGRNMATLNQIVNAQPDQITPSQLAVDGEVKQREFPGPMIQLQSNPDGPDLLQLQRRFLAEQLAFVPRDCAPFRFRGSDCDGIHEWLLCRGKGASC